MVPSLLGSMACAWFAADVPPGTASVNDTPSQPVENGEAMFDVSLEPKMLLLAPANVRTFVSRQIEEGGWPGGHGENPHVGSEVVFSSRSKMLRPTTSHDRPSST